MGRIIVGKNELVEMLLGDLPEELVPKPRLRYGDPVFSEPRGQILHGFDLICEVLETGEEPLA